MAQFRIAVVVLSLVCALVLLSRLDGASANVVHLHKTGKFSGWEYLSKFCFDNQGDANPGTLKWIASGNLTGLSLVLYDDQEFSWPVAYDHRGDWSCHQLIQSPPAKVVWDLVNHPSLTVRVKGWAEPRFWYLVLAGCNQTTLEGLDLFVEFLNPGDFLSKQFSVDIQGELQLQIIFFIVTFITTLIYGAGIVGEAILHFISVGRAKKRVGFNQVRFSLTLIVIVILFSECIGLFLQMTHNLIFAANGVGSFGLDAIGTLFEMVSELLLILLLFLVASGYSITRSRLNIIEITVMVVVLILIPALHLFLLVWSIFFVDPASTLYIFDTLPGLLIAFLRLPMLLFFIFQLVRSFAAEVLRRKQAFYMFFSVFSFWWLVLPVITFFALFLAPYYRNKTVVLMQVGSYTIALFLLSVLMWPTRIDRYWNRGAAASKGSGEELYENL